MPRDELIGRTIANRFRIQRVLGEGGMATVFIAEQDTEPREVALKILRAELTSDRTFAKRFEREAKAAARVQHPNSVTIIDAGVEGQLSYIAMELLRGDDLYSLLERYGVLAPRDAAYILAEVCEALSVAHNLGIVHRDLKPENIMIVHDGDAGRSGVPVPPGSRVKVLDFGIAKLLEKPAPATRRGDDLDPPSQVTAVTRVGTLIGTPAYMSPEQCAMLPIDTRSDIYTCGVLLFQLVTGRMPFEGPSPLHIAMKHIHEEPPALRSILPEAHPALEALIQKALAKKATERQPTARHLGASLRKLLPELPALPYPTALAGRDIDEATTDSYSVDVALSSAVPAAIASAKTVVASGLGGPPPSVLVHGAMERESRPVSSEPEDLAATLVRGEGEAIGTADTIDEEVTTRESAAALGVGRQVTMQSPAAPSPNERASRPSFGGVAPAPLAPPGAAAPQSPAQEATKASVFAPSLLNGPPATAPGNAIVAPTFGLPPAAAGAATRAPMTARLLWLGIVIGAVVSAILFTLVYLLVLGR